MKKICVLSVVLMYALALVSGCAYAQRYDEFEPEDGLMDVQTQALDGKETAPCS